MTGTPTDSSRRLFFANPFPKRQKRYLAQPARSRVFVSLRLAIFRERVAAFARRSAKDFLRSRHRLAERGPEHPPAGSVFTMSKSGTELGIEVGSVMEQNKNIFATVRREKRRETTRCLPGQAARLSALTFGRDVPRAVRGARPMRNVRRMGPGSARRALVRVGSSSLARSARRLSPLSRGRDDRLYEKKRAARVLGSAPLQGTREFNARPSAGRLLQ